MEPFSPLEAVSPMDGRYRRATAPLSAYFSEAALIRYRVWVEVEYLLALGTLELPQIPPFSAEQTTKLRDVYLNFTLEDARRVKSIEAKINHDVKAVEYFIKEKLEAAGLDEYLEFVHFGLTSQDINNTAMPLALKEAWHKVMLPALDQVVDLLEQLARQWRAQPMLARTHGQPASPTTMGKELYVFVERIREQLRLATGIPFAAKFGGATGNFNAHHAAYPGVDWIAFADRLVDETLGLQRSRVTTQIEHYDHLGAFCDSLKRINTILLDLNRDIWTYISLDYFKQEIKAGEVGSSTMPHKVNPIDFENSEGNLGLANAVLEHLAAKLPISRLQRDLTDSTVSRNLGVPLAHALVGLKSLLRGLSKIRLNETKLRQDLEANWAVVAEGIQTILRREGYPKPYEALKELTRTHDHMNEQVLAQFIRQLEVSPEVKAQLARITPHTYIGVDTLPAEI